ncbi:hypothetical protein MRB53_040262 [Persea americana]|nr:hypothetical protein MRB53_040262 [Persea americana]
MDEPKTNTPAYYRQRRQAKQKAAASEPKTNTPAYYRQRRQAKQKAAASAHANKSNRFLNLPYDVHHNILKHCLKADIAIEFCPEPFAFEAGHKDRSGPAQEAREFAKEYQRGEVLRAIGPYNGVLRACRALHNVAANVLYGTNEFRFTNNSGVMGLEYFLYHIDRYRIHEHAKRIRNITVIHPSFMVLPTSLSNADAFFAGIAYFKKIHSHTEDHPKFFHSARWFERWQGNRGWKWLSQIEDLVHLRLIIPRGLRRADIANVENVVPNIEKLQVTIVRTNPTRATATPFPELELNGRSRHRYMLDDDDNEVMASSITFKVARQHGIIWDHEEVDVDGSGCYFYVTMEQIRREYREAVEKLRRQIWAFKEAVQTQTSTNTDRTQASSDSTQTQASSDTVQDQTSSDTIQDQASSDDVGTRVSADTAQTQTSTETEKTDPSQSGWPVVDLLREMLLGSACQDLVECTGMLGINCWWFRMIYGMLDGLDDPSCRCWVFYLSLMCTVAQSRRLRRVSENVMVAILIE